MDIHDLRGIGTAILLIVFVGFWIWAFSKKRKADFSEAELYPFDEETAEKIKAQREGGTNE